MSDSETLEPIFRWFREAGGSVGDEDQVPVELKLGNGLFYLGITDYDDLTIELSALLYLGAESTAEDDKKIVGKLVSADFVLLVPSVECRRARYE